MREMVEEVEVLPILLIVNKHNLISRRRRRPGVNKQRERGQPGLLATPVLPPLTLLSPARPDSSYGAFPSLSNQLSQNPSKY